MFFQVIDILQDVDEWCMDALNGRNTPFLTSFMTLYTGKLIWGFLYMSIALVLFINLKIKHALAIFISIVLVIVFADQLVASLLRPIIERPRPCNPESPVYHMIFKTRTSGGYGFPSCHAANSFGLAMVVYYIFRKRYLTLFLLFWALVNAYTRIYLGMHYPGDILVGFIVGWMAAFFAHSLYKLFIKYIYKDSRYRTLSDVNMKFIWLPISIGLCTIVTIILVSLFRA